MSRETTPEQINCGLVDQAMVERGGRALCDLENEREKVSHRDGIAAGRMVLMDYEEWRDEYDEQARVVLNAALYGGRRS